jgi:hypothetical protein
MAALSSGAFLLGGALETLGPAMYLIFAFLLARAGWGLLRLSPWSRYLVILLAGLGIYLLLPAISSSVADFRLRALALAGVQVISRVLVIWYMLQARVKESFA